MASFPLAFTFPILNQFEGTDGIVVTHGIICLLGSVLVHCFLP
jgi:hypothetical protein